MPEPYHNSCWTLRIKNLSTAGSATIFSLPISGPKDKEKEFTEQRFYPLKTILLKTFCGLPKAGA